MTLTPTQVYAYARAAGFPPDTARKMVAIAQRESSLNPNVIGTLNAAKETSYGLWQINLKDAGIKALMARNGITADNIRDPQINARAAYLLWAGSDSNLNTAWYIDRYGNQYGYAEKYQANLAALPQLELLEMAYSGGGALPPNPTKPPGESNPAAAEPDPRLITEQRMGTTICPTCLGAGVVEVRETPIPTPLPAPR